MNRILEAITVSADEGRPILDAASREVIGYAPIHDLDFLNNTIAKARNAQKGWAETGEAQRQSILHKIADDLDSVADEIGPLITREQGKSNGASEIRSAAIWTRSAADIELNAEVLRDDGPMRTEVHYFPLGVVASIGPWNFPATIAAWHISPALRMGNAVVVKPSENTPLSVLALVEVFNRHLPPGVLTAVSGDREVSAALSSHEDIDKIIFTGSTATGRRIVEASSKNLARLTLELGGNDAGIFLPNTDVAKFAEKVFRGAFMNTGQVCTALKRLYVHSSVYEELVIELARIAEATPQGPGMDSVNVLGPIQNPEQFKIVSGLVDDARNKGARIVTGGEPATELGPLFYRPTIVADIQDGFALVDEEQFGPVLPLIKYESVEDAIALANASEQGLGASVWANDTDTAVPVALRLEAGTVWINQHGGLHPDVPFGGIKASGYGVEFGRDGLKAMATSRVVNIPRAQ